MKQNILTDNFRKCADKMEPNLTTKNYNKKENTEMKRLNLYESKLFGRICYGFGRDENDFVYIKEGEAEVVRMIYDMAINGHSLQNIQTELFNQGIKSPSGKDKWTRNVIDKTINNEKYLTYIISFENFTDASIEKESRCRYVRS